MAPKEKGVSFTIRLHWFSSVLKKRIIVLTSILSPLSLPVFLPPFKQILTTIYVPGIVQDTRDVRVNKTKIPAFLERVLKGEKDKKIV